MNKPTENITIQDTSPDFNEMSPRQNEFRRFLRVFFGRKISAVGFLIILILVISAIFADYIAPYNPIKMDIVNKLQHPSRKHLLGTDVLGRDTLSRIIYGSRTSLVVGFVSVFIASTIGQSVGLIAAYSGGITYAIIMRLTDAIMSIPMILLALVISSGLGGGLRNIVIALGIGMASAQARLMCGQALSIMENDYILAGRAMGAGSFRMMVRHVYPNAFAPLLVMVTIELGTCILAEAGLSFLGIGISPPQPAWGGMVNQGYLYLLYNPMLSFAPGLAIMLVVFGFNMMGDGLRDALDPKLRGVI